MVFRPRRCQTKGKPVLTSQGPRWKSTCKLVSPPNVLFTRAGNVFTFCLTSLPLLRWPAGAKLWELWLLIVLETVLFCLWASERAYNSITCSTYQFALVKNFSAFCKQIIVNLQTVKIKKQLKVDERIPFLFFKAFEKVVVSLNSTQWVDFFCHYYFAIANKQRGSIYITVRDKGWSLLIGTLFRTFFPFMRIREVETKLCSPCHLAAWVIIILKSTKTCFMYILWTLLSTQQELKPRLCITKLWCKAINVFISSFLFSQC